MYKPVNIQFIYFIFITNVYKQHLQAEKKLSGDGVMGKQPFFMWNGCYHTEKVEGHSFLFSDYYFYDMFEIDFIFLTFLQHLLIDMCKLVVNLIVFVLYR